MSEAASQIDEENTGPDPDFREADRFGEWLRTPIPIQIPKNASSAITKALGWADKRHQHRAIHDKTLRAEINQAVAPFVFAIVRHPCDRAVSLYHWIIQGSTALQSRVVAELLKAYGSAAEFWAKADLELLRKYRIEMWVPQWHYLAATDGDGIEPFWGMADGMDHRIDYVGRFEALPESWAHIREQVGSALPEALPVFNQSVHRDWRDELDEAAVARIGDWWRDDFEKLNYAI